MIRRLVSGILLASFLAPGIPPPAGAKAIVIERIVAKINDEIITLSELQDFVNGELTKLRSQYKGTDFENRRRELHLTALNVLIERKLILQQANNIKIVVGDKELESAVQVVLDKNAIRSEQLAGYLRARGETLEKFRETMRTSILVRKVVGREVNFRLSVSEDEIADFYKANVEQFRKGEARWIRQIFFPVPKGAAREKESEQRQKAERAYRRASRNAKNFAAVAKDLSEGPSAPRGGDLGFIKKREVFPEFEKILFSLPVGKVSKVVRTRVGFHVIYVQQLRPGIITPLDRVSGKVRSRLYSEKQAKRRREWISELKRSAFLEVNFSPQGGEEKKTGGTLEALFRDVREQVLFKLIEVKLLGASDLLGREKLFWTYGSNRRDERWTSDRLKVDDSLLLGQDELDTLDALHYEFVNPDPATHLFLYEHNYLLPNSYLGKISFADLIKEFSLSPGKKRFTVTTDEKKVRLSFEVRVEKTRSIVADPKEFK
jgi:peptidyl-prolyl cis-trans isomerase SurA